MGRLFASAVDGIGNTPLVALDRIYQGRGRIFAKMEFVQPGGSVKDRIALRIIQDARASGVLQPGQFVVEQTSGNTGAGLAVVCAVLGHPFIATLSAGNSPEKVRMLQALGAQVVLVPQVDGAPGQVTGRDVINAIETARKLARKRGAFYVDQFNNSSGIRAHEEGTGPEIWEALDGRVDAFVASVGTGGTFVGTSRFLKRRNPAVFCAPVEPEGAEVLAGRPVTKPRHIIEGTSYGAVPPHWQPGLADDFLAVTDDEVEHVTRELARKEGLFVGFSAGANVCAAVKLLESGRLEEGAHVVTVLCDTGMKYEFD